MDQATIVEEANLRAQLAKGHVQLKALRAEHKIASDRLAAIHRAETIRTLNPNHALNQGPDPRVSLELK
jgi:hypothetical protein